MSQTHEVINQVPPHHGYDAAAAPALVEGLRREGADWATGELHELGILAGSEQAADWGRLVNENPPVLRTHDRYGHRIDEVEFHPYWHELMSIAVGSGLHATPWQEPRPGAHVARAAKFYVWGQVEAGHTCPVSMTYTAVPALRTTPGLAEWLEPLLASRTYDFGLRAPRAAACNTDEVSQVKTRWPHPLNTLSAYAMGVGGPPPRTRPRSVRHPGKPGAAPGTAGRLRCGPPSA